MKNYYEILGVSKNSETEVITAAYKAMMRKYHPDTNKSAHIMLSKCARLCLKPS